MTAGQRISSGSIDNDTEVDLTSLFRTLWRGRFFIIFCAVLAVTIGIWYAYFQATAVYTSSAVVALESRQEQVVDIESVLTGLSGDQATINTEVEVIRSRGLMEKLVLKLDLLDDPEFNKELQVKPSILIGDIVDGLRGALVSSEKSGDAGAPEIFERKILDATIDSVLEAVSVSNIRQSYVFRITATTEEAPKSALIANTLAELYILEQLEVKFEATEQATAWLTERVGQLRAELEAAEAAAKEFNTGTTLVSPEALIGLNRQLKELRDRVREMSLADKAAAMRVSGLQAAQQEGDPANMIDVAQDITLNRMYQLIKKNASDDPDLRAFNARFAQVLKRAELEQSRAAGQIKTLQASVVELEQQIAGQSADLVVLQQLQREAEASRLIYEFFLQRLKETSVQQGIQQADSRVLSQAVIPLNPSAPRKSMILALAMILGVMIGAGMALLREYSQNTFRDSGQLEAHTGRTVIGQIPLIPIRRRKKLLQYLLEKPTSATVEAIRNLRTSVLLADLDNPPQVILSTSSIPGEGKTTISLSLAQNLSGLGKKVLVLEGDIRRRTFTEYFETGGKRGLMSLLSGDALLEDVLFRVPLLENVDVLIGEKSKTNATDVFSSRKFGELLKDLRQEYDHIIIDAPPVLVVPDARVIGQVVDAVLYTVRWDSTHRRQVRDGLKAFDSVDVRVTGLVLNQISSKGMKGYGYGENYGAYGAYYNN